MLKGDRPVVLRARQLRKHMSLPEGLLWRELRKRPGGFKFRRQHPGGFYVLDFFCSEAKLGIEVDGEAHSVGDQPQFDEKRDAWLQLHGIETLRIPASEILKSLEGVIVHILEAARQRLPLRQPDGLPPPRTGEELNP